MRTILTLLFCTLFAVGFSQQIDINEQKQIQVFHDQLEQEVASVNTKAFYHQRLDSVVRRTSNLYDSGVNRYTYDHVTNRLLMHEAYSPVDYSSRVHFSYHANGDIDEFLVEIKYPGPSGYVYSSKREYTYQGTVLSSYEDLYYDVPTAQWVPAYKFDRFVDANGLDTLNLRWYWDIALNQYYAQEKTVKVYNSAQELITKIRYDTDSSMNWLLSYKYEYAYDNNGLLLQEEYWRFMNSAWKRNLTRQYAYDNSGMLHLYKETGYYNGSSTLKIIDSVLVDPLNGNLILRYYWRDSANQLFEKVQEVVFELDPGYDMDDFLTPGYFEYMQIGLGTKNVVPPSKPVSYESVTNHSGYMDTSDGVYYYSLLPLAVSEPSIVETALFPNPAKDYVQITVPATGDIQLELFDINGKLVRSIQTAGENMLYIGDLEAGVYVYQLHDTHTTLSGKLVICE